MLSRFCGYHSSHLHRPVAASLRHHHHCFSSLNLADDGVVSSSSISTGRETTGTLAGRRPTGSVFATPPSNSSLPHIESSKCYAGRATAKGLQTAQAKKILRGRERPRQGQQLLPPHRDVPRHVCRNGAVLPTTVRVSLATSALAHSYDLSNKTSSKVTQSTTPSKRDRSPPGSAASTPCAATPQAKSAALPASSAKLSARRRPSRSKPKSEKTAREGRHGMILI